MTQITHKEAWDAYLQLRQKVAQALIAIVGNTTVELTEAYMFGEIIDRDFTGNYYIRLVNKDGLTVVQDNDTASDFGENSLKKFDDLNTQDLIHVLRLLEEGKYEVWEGDEDD